LGIGTILTGVAIAIVNGLQRVRPGVSVAQTRVAMGHDLPALANLAADEAASANAAF